MAELKPFASLSSGLLARKGAAKPAMRPQGFGQMGVSMEDLGWNDMGHTPHAPAPSEERREPLPEHVPSSIAALTPAPRLHAEPQPHVEPAPVAEEAGPPPPPVVEQQRAIEEHFAEKAEEPKAAAPAPQPVVEQQPAVEEHFAEKAEELDAVARAPQPRINGSAKALPRERKASGAKDKSAFTLRLDSERHLKLRLACALTHRSAQIIVTDALDRFLASVPELEALTGHLPKAGKTN